VQISLKTRIIVRKIVSDRVAKTIKGITFSEKDAENPTNHET
jgi:hypothetical protein